MALELARRIGGVVINADSQQLFADLPILTAQPGPADTAEIPHRLYGVLGAHEQPSVGRWLALLTPALEAARRDGVPALVVGGTGLYLHALLHGIPEMPDIPDALRGELREWAEVVRPGDLHARLAARDPEMAARLQPGDSQRLLRALEVIEATGRSLIQWQATPRRRPALPDRTTGLALAPPAAVVSPRIEARLAGMLEAGAMAEVRGLLTRHADATRLPIGKVHGLRELAAVSEGRLELDVAKASIAAQVRGYAKRQRTWFRHHLPELAWVAEVGASEAAIAIVLQVLRD